MRSMMTRSLALTAAYCIFFLIGCATTLTTIPQDYTLGAKDESVVIGRLVVDLDNSPLPFFANLGRMGLTVRNEATEKDYGLVCDRTGLDSEFFASLPPGRYRFVRVNAMNAVSQLPPARFEVGAGQVLYLGTIRYRGQSLLGPGRWLVDDESEKTVKSFRERYPRISQPVVKSALIVLTVPVPGKTVASPLLQQDVLAMIMTFERLEDTACTDRKVANTEILRKFETRLGTPEVTEQWTLDRCGKAIPYQVRLVPSPRGGTDFYVVREGERGVISSQPVWSPH